MIIELTKGTRKRKKRIFYVHLIFHLIQKSVRNKKKDYKFCSRTREKLILNGIKYAKTHKNNKNIHQ